jgi:hypothetical protein
VSTFPGETRASAAAIIPARPVSSVNLVNALALIANPVGTRSPAESSSPKLALFPPNAEASDRRSSESGQVKLTLTRPCIHDVRD